MLFEWGDDGNHVSLNKSPLWAWHPTTEWGETALIKWRDGNPVSSSCFFHVTEWWSSQTGSPSFSLPSTVPTGPSPGPTCSRSSRRSTTQGNAYRATALSCSKPQTLQGSQLSRAATLHHHVNFCEPLGFWLTLRWQWQMSQNLTTSSHLFY